MNNNYFKKSLADTLGKIDNKVLQAKLNMALDTLKSGSIDELGKLLNSMDKDLLIEKLHELDKSTIHKLNINAGEIKKRITDSDLEKLSRIVGKRGNEVVKKIKELLG
ncbi:MAG: hypothetical protein ACOYWZ_10150 [Bacillota bacterium]